MVRATGIWSEVTAVEHDKMTPAQLQAAYPDLADPVLTAVQEFGGTGLQTTTGVAGTKNWLANGILFQFTVVPPNIGNEEGIYFDITRRQESRWWKMSKDGVLIVLCMKIPSFRMKFTHQRFRLKERNCER